MLRTMRIAVLGAGAVGQALAGKLRGLGHDVSIGTRSPRDGAVSYAEAAGGAELVINATSGAASLEALDAAGAENLAGKVLIDVSNPSAREGLPPSRSATTTASASRSSARTPTPRWSRR
jgi:8-hydroxy-5-deazaflavin:NADPH oxidoreductase